MGILDLFGKAWEIFRNNPILVIPELVFGLVIALLDVWLVKMITPFNNAAVPMIGAGAGSRVSSLIHLLPGIIGFSLVIIILSLVVGLLIAGFYISSADQGLKKKKVSLSMAWTQSKKAFLSLLGANLLYFILYVILGCIFVGIILGAAVIGSGLAAVGVAIIFGVIFVLISIYIGILLYLLDTVIVLDGKGAIDGLKRSMEICRNDVWTILGIVIVTVVIAIVWSIIVSLIGVGVSLTTGGPGSAAQTAVSEGVIQILEAPLVVWISFIPVMYYNTYVKKAKPAAKRKTTK